ncbi:MAG: hypothetical protein QW334_04305, partial [Thermofilum sp.]
MRPAYQVNKAYRQVLIALIEPNRMMDTELPDKASVAGNEVALLAGVAGLRRRKPGPKRGWHVTVRRLISCAMRGVKTVKSFALQLGVSVSDIYYIVSRYGSQVGLMLDVAANGRVLFRRHDPYSMLSISKEHYLQDVLDYYLGEIASWFWHPEKFLPGPPPPPPPSPSPSPSLRIPLASA